MSTIKSSDEHLTINADGSGKDIKFQANGVEKASIDSSGNVGIGVTPKTWDSRKALQIGGNGTLAGSASAGAGGYLQLLQNAYTDGTWKYISTDEAARLRSQDGQWNFDVAASGSADSAITWATKVTIDTDGLKFGTDTAAANALHDYEEGTWTPVFTFDSGTFSGSYAANAGMYTKVGRIVHASFHFNTSSVNLSGIDSNTAVRVGGLPFTSSSTNGNTSSTSTLRTQNWNNNAHSPVIGYMDANTNFIRLMRYNGSTGYNTDYKCVSADLRTSNDSNQLMGTITYQAS